MIPFWSTFVAEMAERASGPLWLRLILQPLVAGVLAIRSGLRDAREGRPPYFWAMLTDPPHRQELLRDGWKVVGKVFLLVIAFDTAYQLIVDRMVALRHSLILALVLAILPYLVLRGLTNRLMRAGGGIRRCQARPTTTCWPSRPERPATSAATTASSCRRRISTPATAT